METLKAISALLLTVCLCGCSTPDQGYKRNAPSFGSFSKIQELRKLLLLPPRFQLVEGMGQDYGGGLNCADPEVKISIAQEIEAAIAKRMSDWKDYDIVRPALHSSEARNALVKLREQLAADVENRPFAEKTSDDVLQQLNEIGKQYAVDGVVVFSARQVEMTAATFGKMLAISLPTLGIGGMAYAFTVSGPFAEAAIYDIEGHLQWWYRGQVNSYWCSQNRTSGVASVLDSLPNAKPAVLSTHH